MTFLDTFRSMFTLQVAVAAAVFFVVSAVLIAALLISRRRSPDRRTKNTRPWLEGGYAVLLGCVAGAIVYVTFFANQDVNTPPNGYHVSNQPGAVKVDVTAYQWCWNFHYTETTRNVSGSCQLGNRDLPTLVVPTGRPVELRLTASDVVHSFWVPDLAVKMDAFPDHTNTLTITFDREGRWLGKCAEFCGTHHAAMHFYVRAVSPDKYQQFLQQGISV